MSQPKRVARKTAASARKAPTAKVTRPDRIVVDVKDLKKAFGDRLEIACLNSKAIPGTRGGTIMIPANEPCPVNPHNHDKVPGEKLFQKVAIIRL